MYKNKVLIGGQALVELGSSRSTEDIDYLVFDDNSFDQFIFDRYNNIDYMNGNGSNFAEAIWDQEKENEIASPQSLFELKAFSLLSHFKNFNKNKMNDAIYDLRFLNINFGIDSLKTLKNYITPQEQEFILDQIK